MGTRDDEYDYLFKGKFPFEPKKWKWDRHILKYKESEASEEVR